MPSHPTNSTGDLFLPPPLEPRRRSRRRPLPVDEIARRLAPLCREYGVTWLEIFGSTARGDVRRSSDVDLIVT
jgi:predicted nucleotidyltransferase